MAPIVKSKRHIAILLNFKNHNVIAQRVHGARGDEYCIARLGNDTHKVVDNGSIVERLTQTVGCCTRCQAGIDMASLFSFNHNPRFGLCRIPRRNQRWLSIAGMYLNRKHLVRIQKLEQQWKAAEARRKLPHQLVSELLHYLP